jgi:aminoglycoside phosphotransferase
MVSDNPRVLGPGVAETIGRDPLNDVGADRGIALLRPRGKRAIAVLHQRPPDTASILDEADRLLWLAGESPAPEVVASSRADEGDESIAIRLGADATSADAGHPMGPEALVGTLAASLVALHGRPIGQCPFSADTRTLRSVVDDRIARGSIDEAAEGPYAGRSPTTLAQIYDGLMADLGEVVDPVFIHASLAPSRVWLDPNGEVTFLGWQWAGVGDRHLDLAAAATTLTQLYGPALVGPFFDAYGLDRVDLRRLDAHQLLSHLLS